MESGRFLLAVVLMIAVVVVTNIILPPSPPATPGEEPGPVPADTAAVDPLPSPTPTDPAPAPPPEPAAETALPADTVIVSSRLWRYGISTRGGALVLAVLDSFPSYTSEGEPVQLVPEETTALIGHRVRIGERTIDLSTLDFRPSTESFAVSGSEPGTLHLTHEDSAGPRIELIYTFHPETYLYDVEARIAGAGSGAQLLIDLGPTLRRNDVDVEEDRRNLAFVVNSVARGIESESLGNLESQEIVNGPLTWAAIKNKYFLAAVLSSPASAMPFGGVIARPLGEDAVDLTVTLPPNPEGILAYRAYVGPQKAEHLAAVGHQLTDVNPFGWKFLQPLLRPVGHAIVWALVGMHTALGLAYGWVLVLFGVLIRIVLWPLNAKAMRSQMKTMELQPRLKEIQARYKNEPERLQKEMLRLYKEEGFNPMGGCLPMLIPFPILIALFFVFQSTIEFRGVSFLWLPDLSRADPFYILPVALGVSMFALQYLSTRTATEQNPQMKMMMYFMPIFMTVIFLNFASGLNLYYASMNVASVPQQLQIMKERRRFQARRQAGGT